MDASQFKGTMLLCGIGVLFIGLALVGATGLTPKDIRPKLDLAARFCMYTGGGLLLISSR